MRSLFLVLTIVLIVLVGWSVMLQTSRPATAPSFLRSYDTATPAPTSPLLPPNLESEGVPTEVVIPLRTHVFQTFNNCGPASLSMLLSYFDTAVSQAEIGRRLRPVHNPQGIDDDKSVTLEDLAAEAERRGFVAFYRPNGSPALLRQAIANGYPVVIRTWLKPNEDIGHYRVIRGYTDAGASFVQDDSLQGANLSYTASELQEIWQPFNYEFLLIAPENQRDKAEAILGELADERQAWQLAAERVQSELLANPEDRYARFNQSVIFARLGDYTQSVASFELVENQLPRRMLWYQIEPIQAYLEVGNYDRVFALTDSILNNGNRAFSELYTLRAEAYRRLGQPAAAARENELATQYSAPSLR